MAFRRSLRALAKRPTREDAFLFDNNGFFQLRGALSTEEVAALNAGIDAAAGESVERSTEALKNTKAGSGMSAKGSRTDLGGMLSWDGAPGAAFRSLLCHPKCKPFLEAFLGVGYRLDHQPLCLIQGPDSEGFQLHGGPLDSNGSFNPELQYRFGAGGTMWNSLVGMSVSLVDQEDGDGGFCILPGSHKSNFPLPPDFRHGDSSAFREFIHTPHTKAGDVIFFSEATIHGALPWRSQDKQRRLALYRFSPANMGYGRAYTENWGDSSLETKCTEDEWSVLQPPYAPRMDRKLVGREINERTQAKKDHDLRIFGTKYF